MNNTRARPETHQTHPLNPSAEMVRVFLNQLFAHAGDATYISLRAFDDQADKSAPPLFTEPVRLDAPALVDRVCSKIAIAANHQRPSVFCPPVCTFKNANGAKLEDLAEGLAISAELDQAPAAGLAKLIGVLGKPTVTVRSGGEWLNPTTGNHEPKLHAHWRLAEPAQTAEEHERLREARELAAELAGGDRSNVSIVHPIRWPGSWHRKDPNRPRIAAILDATDAELELNDALAKLRAACPRQQRAKSNGNGRAQVPAEDVASALEVIPPTEDRALWIKIGEATFAATGGSDEGFQAWDAWSRKARNYGGTEKAWASFFKSPPRSIGFGTLYHHATEADSNWIPPSRRPRGPRPVIEVVKGDRLKNLAEVQSAIIADTEHAALYQRSRHLVRLLRDPRPGPARSLLSLEPVVKDYALIRMGQAADFRRYDGRAKEWRPCDATDELAAALLANAGGWPFPPIVAVIEAPTLRLDGSVLQDPGYDAATGLYFDPAIGFPPVPEGPTRDDALEALATLKRPLRGFPFVGGDNGAAQSVALALTLTMLIRRTLPSAPMFLVDAPERGTGKTKLTYTAELVAFGRRVATSAYSGETEEQRKQILATLLAAHPVVVYDNVERTIRGAALCAALTAPEYSDRKLGVSEQHALPTCTTFVATGNNIAVQGDMLRRVLSCRMDARCEKPFERTFDFDCEEEAAERRADLVCAGLTILRAYAVSGQSVALTPFGSFEEWSRRVREALVWLGCADPHLTQESVMTSDTEDEASATLLVELHKQYAAASFRVKDAVAKATTETDHLRNDDLKTALEAALPKGINSRSLGWWLRRHLDRVVGGLALRRTGEEHKTALWRVLAISEEK
jgi:putative DNA primase/helicase